jgi:hypothetical protein
MATPRLTSQAQPKGAAAMNTATITVLEQSSPYDDYDTENGVGHADEVEVYEVETVEVETDDPSKFDGEIASALHDLGLDQWDGGNTAYDPDGSSMAADAAGTITTRWARIDR